MLTAEQANELSTLTVEELIELPSISEPAMRDAIANKFRNADRDRGFGLDSWLEYQQKAGRLIRARRATLLKNTMQAVVVASERMTDALSEIPHDNSTSKDRAIAAQAWAELRGVFVLIERAAIQANELCNGRVSNVVTKLELALRSAQERLGELDDDSEVGSEIAAALNWRKLNREPEVRS